MQPYSGVFIPVIIDTSCFKDTIKEYNECMCHVTVITTTDCLYSLVNPCVSTGETNFYHCHTSSHSLLLPPNCLATLYHSEEY